MTGAAFFDLDETVIAKASMAAFCRTFHDNGLLSRRSMARALYAQLVYLHLGASELRLDRIREAALALTKGWDRDRVSAVIEETLEEVVDPIVFREAVELIDEHHRAGRRVIVVSASPEEIVVPLGRHLGVDGTIASRAMVDDANRYTGEMEFYAYGQFKADAIIELARREGIDLGESYAYSDSYTDAPMLEIVGHPVAVNPDRVLLRLARERGWDVRQFVKPVRLRDKMAPRRPTFAVTGAVAVGAGAVVVGWWLEARRENARLSPLAAS